MTEHNEYGVIPGAYALKRGIIVVLDLITHSEIEGDVTMLGQPWVVYRDLTMTQGVHRRYMMALSEWKKLDLKLI